MLLGCTGWTPQGDVRSWAHHHSCRHQHLKKPMSWLSRPAPSARANAQGHTPLHCHTHRAMLTNPSVCMGTCKHTHQCLCAEDTPITPAASSRMQTCAQSRYRDAGKSHGQKQICTRSRPCTCTLAYHVCTPTHGRLRKHAQSALCSCTTPSFPSTDECQRQHGIVVRTAWFKSWACYFPALCDLEQII